MEEEDRSNGYEIRPDRKDSDWGYITPLDKTKEFFQTCDVEGKGFITRKDMRVRKGDRRSGGVAPLMGMFMSIGSTPPLSHMHTISLADMKNTGRNNTNRPLQSINGVRAVLADNYERALLSLVPFVATRLHRELPLSAEELEDVFDSLDTDHTGYLTLETFSSGFSRFPAVRDLLRYTILILKLQYGNMESQFLHGRRISVTDDQNQASGPVFRAKEALYQSQWEAKLSGEEDEEERHFCMLMESLGASNVFEEKSATHDSEIRHLYEEMEAQIKTEKDRLLLKKDTERLQLRSQDLEHQLISKERELEQLFQKQKGLELQFHELNSKKQESHVENVKLKMTNDELSRALRSTSQELALAQGQLATLHEQAARLQQEKEMEMYRVTEGLQREKQSLMKQLDLLRAPLLVDGSYQSLEALPIEHLQIVFVASSSCSEDDTTITSPSFTTTVSPSTCQQRPTAKKNSSLANVCANSTPPKVHDVKPKAKKSQSKVGAAKRVTGKDRERVNKVDSRKKTEVEEEVLDAPPDGWPLRRVISIEEDHLPHLLQGGPQPLMHQLSEEEDEEDSEEEEKAQSDSETSTVMAVDLSAVPPSNHLPVLAKAPPARKSRFSRAKKAPTSPRGQPVGKETQHVCPQLWHITVTQHCLGEPYQGHFIDLSSVPAFSLHHKAKEGALFAPDRLFKVVLVGNSSVGKTSLLRSFCEGRFHPVTTATVGIDYSVKTLTLDNVQVAMQLWDTAGQERYRSITKQFFRKADGVVVMYDVTVQESFKAVQTWLINVQEAAGEGIPILLLGNKMDMEGDREVSFKDAEQLAYGNKVMFFEVSAYTGKNVTESLTHLARVLMEQEDRVRDPTVILSAHPMKKKACCK
ncbi:Ras-related protein Rab-44 [Channa argus]|uniref:Ras-related protein Rab-44 n=1 Tax=Channa argus TaxID=215402 RepID=A0A6G1QRG7_CHAAH|nr:Ras-related protein Rab-44 [Channa argus]